MSNSISNLPRVQTAISEQAESSSHTASPNAEDVTSKQAKLPYRATHQVELLHLQAEIDALLQQLQTLKQQRNDSPSEDLVAEQTNVPVLAGR